MSDLQHKHELRARARTFRHSLSPSELSSASRAVVENLRRVPEIADASAVHTFLPTASLAELDIEPLINDLLERKVEVVVPVVSNFSRKADGGPAAGPAEKIVTGQPRISHCRLTSTTSLRENRWGVREPEDCQVVDIATIDVIIVPALACDRNGFRLGFGYGYYDEIIGQLNTTAVCPCLDALLFDSLPTEEHDRPVDIIVTESSILRPHARQSSL